MSERHNLEYYQIAAFQIDAAIDQYLQGTLASYICAITLAGAGEEILGKLLRHQHNKDSALDKNVEEMLFKQGIKKSSQDFQRLKKEYKDMLNKPRNAFKHFKEDFCEEDVDPHLFAEMMINRAIINYGELRNSITQKMSHFLDFTKQEREE